MQLLFGCAFFFLKKHPRFSARYGSKTPDGEADAHEKRKKRDRGRRKGRMTVSPPLSVLCSVSFSPKRKLSLFSSLKRGPASGRKRRRACLGYTFALWCASFSPKRTPPLFPQVMGRRPRFFRTLRAGSACSVCSSTYILALKHVCIHGG